MLASTPIWNRCIQASAFILKCKACAWSDEDGTRPAGGCKDNQLTGSVRLREALSTASYDRDY